MESLGRPPAYTLRKERLGNHRKFWTIRQEGKFVTAFASKGDATGWIHAQEPRKERNKY